MSGPDFWRQLDIASPENFRNLHFAIIGCGGIGSPTAMVLTKMGVGSIELWDDDSVECHNLPNQLFPVNDVGMKKVDSLRQVCYTFSKAELTVHPERFDSTKEIRGVVISAVDTMAARKEIWERVKYNPSVPFYIEARMGAELGRIHSFVPSNPADIRWYEQTLYSDEEAEILPCTARAIIYNIFIIAGLIARQVKRFARGEAREKELIFDLATMTLLAR